MMEGEEAGCFCAYLEGKCMSARCRERARGGKHVGAVIIGFGFWKEKAVISCAGNPSWFELY
jgi:hypothetical protein